MDIMKIRAIKGGFLLKMDSLERRLELLSKRNDLLRRFWITLEDDKTPREIEVQKCICERAMETGNSGIEISVGYLKAKAKGKLHIWDKRRGEMTETGQKRSFFAGNGREAPKTQLKRRVAGGIECSNWNRAGIGNVKKCWGSLQHYDIILLQEAWLDEK